MFIIATNGNPCFSQWNKLFFPVFSYIRHKKIPEMINTKIAELYEIVYTFCDRREQINGSVSDLFLWTYWAGKPAVFLWTYWAGKPAVFTDVFVVFRSSFQANVDFIP
jgi:hypothetical protein